MSQAALELVDPGSAFLAAGNPEAFLADNLPSTDSPSPEPDGHRRAVIAIAGGFMAWRLFFISEARHQPSPPMDPDGLLQLLWRKRAPIWLRLTQPAISDVLAASGLTGEELQAVAVDYAAKLGAYVHDTSAKAVVAGYREQLRRGVSPTLSWLRALEGYGLDDRSLRSWVAQQAVQEGPVADLIRPGARRALDRAILMRADVLGQTEAWHARQVGKSIAWMVEDAEGLMPYGTMKRWLTADDELVCKICGPLHLQEVKLSEQFVLPDKRRLWAPGVHPNCRCELALVYPSYTFQKAAPGDPYDRDRDGQFARQESRQRRVVRPLPVAERETDPALQALVEAMAQPQEEEIPSLLDQTPSLLSTPSLVETPSLFANIPSLFTAVPSLLEHGAVIRPKTTGRRLKILILVDGKVQEVDGEEIGHDRENLVYVPVDEFYAMPRRDPVTGVEVDLRGHPGEPVDIHRMVPGVVVDFDDWAINAAHRTHTDPKVGMPFKGYAFTGGDHVNSLLRDLDAFYEHAERTDASTEELMDTLYEQQNGVMEQIWGNKEDFVAGLSDDEVLALYVEAGMRGYARQARITRGIDALRQDIIVMLDGDVPPGYGPYDAESIEQAIVEYVQTESAEIQAVEAMIEESNAGFRKSPQIFTFKDNNVGGVWHDEGNGKFRPYLTGKYRVTEVRVHTVNPKFTGIKAENPRIKNWREVILERIEDDELPHDLHRGSRGY